MHIFYPNRLQTIELFNFSLRLKIPQAFLFQHMASTIAYPPWMMEWSNPGQRRCVWRLAVWLFHWSCIHESGFLTDIKNVLKGCFMLLNL